MFKIKALKTYVVGKVRAGRTSNDLHLPCLIKFVTPCLWNTPKLLTVLQSFKPKELKVIQRGCLKGDLFIAPLIVANDNFSFFFAQTIGFHVTHVT